MFGYRVASAGSVPEPFISRCVLSSIEKRGQGFGQPADQRLRFSGGGGLGLDDQPSIAEDPALQAE